MRLIVLCLLAVTAVVAQTGDVPATGALMQSTGVNPIPIVPVAGTTAAPAASASGPALLGSSGEATGGTCLQRFGDQLPAENDQSGFLSAPLVSALQPCLTDFQTNTCSTECKNSLSTVLTNTGCCFQPLLDTLLNRVPTAFAVFISDRATITAFIQGPCALTIQPTCAGETAVTPVSNNSTASIIDILTLFGLPSPTIAIDWLKNLPWNSLTFHDVSQQLLWPYKNLDTSKWSQQCQLAVMAWRNTTGICFSAFDNAVANLRVPANHTGNSTLLGTSTTTTGSASTTSMTAPTLLLNGQSTPLDNSKDWGKVCTANMPTCTNALNADLSTITSACGSDFDLDVSVPMAFWDVLCATGADNKYCFPAVQQKLYMLQDQSNSISLDQIVSLCDDCSARVIAGFASLPNEFNITGVLPLVCSTITDQVCLPFLDMGNETYSNTNTTTLPGAGSTGTVLPGGPTTDCSTFDNQLPPANDEGAFLSSPIVTAMQPCLTDFGANTCSADCKASIQPFVTSTGCCFSGLMDTFFTRVPGAFSALIPPKEQVIAFITGPCAITVAPPCSQQQEVPTTPAAPTTPATPLPASNTTILPSDEKTYCSPCLNRLYHRIEAYAPLLINGLSDNEQLSLPSWLNIDELQSHSDICITLPTTGVAGQCVDHYLDLLPSTNSFSDFTSWISSNKIISWLPCYESYKNKTCTTGCAALIKNVIANYSCCVPLILDTLYQRIPLMYDSFVPDRTAILSFINNDCGIVFEPACGTAIANPAVVEEAPRQAVRLDLLLPNLKFDWYSTNKQLCNDALRRDLMGATGLESTRIIIQDGVDAATTAAGTEVTAATGGAVLPPATAESGAVLPPAVASTGVAVLPPVTASTGVALPPATGSTGSASAVVGTRIVCWLRTGNLKDATDLQVLTSKWLLQSSLAFPNLASLPLVSRIDVSKTQYCSTESTATTASIPTDIAIPEENVAASSSGMGLLGSSTGPLVPLVPAESGASGNLLPAESGASGSALPVTPIASTAAVLPVGSTGLASGPVTPVTPIVSGQGTAVVPPTSTLSGAAGNPPAGNPPVGNPPVASNTGREAVATNDNTNAAVGAQLNQLLSMVAVVLSIVALL